MMKRVTGAKPRSAADQILLAQIQAAEEDELLEEEEEEENSSQQRLEARAVERAGCGPGEGGGGASGASTSARFLACSSALKNEDPLRSAAAQAAHEGEDEFREFRDTSGASGPIQLGESCEIVEEDVHGSSHGQDAPEGERGGFQGSSGASGFIQLGESCGIADEDMHISRHMQQDAPEEERGGFRGSFAVAGPIQLGESCEVQEEGLEGTDEHERHDAARGESGEDLFRWTPSKETSAEGSSRGRLQPVATPVTSAAATGRLGTHSEESAGSPGPVLEGSTRSAERRSTGGAGGESSQGTRRGRHRVRNPRADAAAAHSQRLAEEILAAEREELLEEEEGEEEEEREAEVHEDMEENEGDADGRRATTVQRQEGHREGVEGRGETQREEGARGEALEEEGGGRGRGAAWEESSEDAMEEDDSAMELALGSILAPGQAAEGGEEEEEEEEEMELVQPRASAEELRQLALLREVDMEELEEEEEEEEEEGEEGQGGEWEDEEERLMEMERQREDDSLFWLLGPFRAQHPRFPSPIRGAFDSTDPTEDPSVGPQHFNLGLASLHTYLGELEALSGVVKLGKPGEVLRIPVIYLEGVVLFPDQTLPLRLLQPGCLRALEVAMAAQGPAARTIGILLVHRTPRDAFPGRRARVGTMAEIKMMSRGDDGAVTAITKGRQRFWLKRAWTEGPQAMPMGEVEVLPEVPAPPLPRAAFGRALTAPGLRSGHLQRLREAQKRRGRGGQEGGGGGAPSEGVGAGEGPTRMRSSGSGEGSGRGRVSESGRGRGFGNELVQGSEGGRRAEGEEDAEAQRWLQELGMWEEEEEEDEGMEEEEDEDELEEDEEGEEEGEEGRVGRGRRVLGAGRRRQRGGRQGAVWRFGRGDEEWEESSEDEQREQWRTERRALLQGFVFGGPRGRRAQAQAQTHAQTQAPAQTLAGGQGQDEEAEQGQEPRQGQGQRQGQIGATSPVSLVERLWHRQMGSRQGSEAMPAVNQEATGAAGAEDITLAAAVTPSRAGPPATVRTENTGLPENTADTGLPAAGGTPGSVHMPSEVDVRRAASTPRTRRTPPRPSAAADAPGRSPGAGAPVVHAGSAAAPRRGLMRVWPWRENAQSQPRLPEGVLPEYEMPPAHQQGQGEAGTPGTIFAHVAQPRAAPSGSPLRTPVGWPGSQGAPGTPGIRQLRRELLVESVPGSFGVPPAVDGSSAPATIEGQSVPGGTDRAGSGTPAAFQRGAPEEEQRRRQRRRRARAWGGAGALWAFDEQRVWAKRAALSVWPHWVYRQYDPFQLARRVADMFCDAGVGDLMRDPERLSYAVAAALPCDDLRRLGLLQQPNTVYRLQAIVRTLEVSDHLVCSHCLPLQHFIGRRSDMLAMSADGPLNAFVNAHGFVHETLTLKEARGLHLVGRAETENSWFPGYAWTIANCARCESHIGWRFNAVRRGLEPSCFWGLRRSQLNTTGGTTEASRGP